MSKFTESVVEDAAPPLTFEVRKKKIKDLYTAQVKQAAEYPDAL